MRDSIIRILTWAKANPAVVVSSLSLMVAALGFILTHFGRLQKGIRILRSWLGFPEARYATRFLQYHRELRNIYLNRVEILDIQSTYVPLNVIDPAEGRDHKPAIEVLLNPARPRILILGDPGTGKSTLLKAFAVSLLSYHPYSLGKRGGEKEAKGASRFVPVYVELRDFAAKREKHPTLHGYIVNYVLASQFGMDVGAEMFFKRLWAKDRCVLLLDALDEVGREDYDAVRAAVHEFFEDYVALPLSRDDSQLLAHGVRVVLTSRLQNFLPVIDDWIPGGFLNYYVLSPFSDRDILQFLQNRASEIPPDKTVANLWNEIKNSGTIDLHRTPLILTVSLGLYIHAPRYSIPESIANFYQEITRELLQRHDFRTRTHLEKRNQFPFENKAQFLREFAFGAALRPKFDEFTYQELSDAFGVFYPRVPRLKSDDRVNFLAEIIDNAGLLRSVGDGIYVFAHRSFHEYFAADYLARYSEIGIEKCLGNALNPLWRQVIVFFSAMEHGRHDSLLEGLSLSNPELAGHCLAVARLASPSIAMKVIQRLDEAKSKTNILSLLSALSAICRGSIETVKGAAIAVISKTLGELMSPEQSKALWGLNKDDLLHLARELAATGTRKVADTCINLSLLVEEDSRFVEPLWLCLSSFIDEPRTTEAGRLVSRLLGLVQSEEGFQVLQTCSSFASDFIDEELRSFVYPFSSERERFDNLITLLAWADLVNVMPQNKNGFLEAFSLRAQRREEWSRLEKELSKKTLTVSARPIGVVLLGAGLILCLWPFLRGFEGRELVEFGALQASLGQGPVASILTLWLAGVFLTVIFGLVQPWLARTRLTLAIAEPQRFLSITSPPLMSTKRKDLGVYPQPPNPIVYQLDRRFKWLDEDGSPFWDWDCPAPIMICGVAQVPLFYAALYLLPGMSLATQFAGGAILSAIIFWVPATRLFLPGSYLALRRRSPLATLISNDSSSELWIPKLGK